MLTETELKKLITQQYPVLERDLKQEVMKLSREIADKFNELNKNRPRQDEWKFNEIRCGNGLPLDVESPDDHI